MWHIYMSYNFQSYVCCVSRCDKIIIKFDEPQNSNLFTGEKAHSNKCLNKSEQ